MTREEALNFIHGVSWRGSVPGLERIRTLLSMLGNPEKRLRFVHVAGTNGKGSTCAMLASILTEEGFKTGLYTSPYIMRFEERIRIDGEPISGEELADIMDRVKACVDTMEDKPTEFELITAGAMLYYAEKECDIIVLEVGMGGRLDATNIIEAPEVSVIANIGMDHTAELGDTLTKIAGEKAGIIKSGRPVVSYLQEPEAAAVIADVSAKMGSDLHTAEFGAIESITAGTDGQHFRYKGREYTLSLMGENQLKNASVVLETVETLRSLGWNISDRAVEKGLSSVRWPARFELICRDPVFILDGGHNPQCIGSMTENLDRYFPSTRRVMLVGVLRDKDWHKIMEMLAPYAAEFVTVTPRSPRALPAEELAAYLEQRFQKKAKPCGSIAEGVETAIRTVGDGMVCAVGSLYTAGEIREFFGLK